jgi:hypothetical protein
MARRREARPLHGVTWGLRLLAVAIVAMVLLTATHDVSQAWDVWYYHLPFAARLAGVVPADRFVFDAANQARFDGFPLLAERAQGILWRLTGRPEAANLLCAASVPLFAWWHQRRYAVPWFATVLALFAVPLVQTHAASAYVDLPANAALSVAVLIAIDAWVLEAPPKGADVAVAVLAAAAAANSKVMLQPLAFVALAALAARARRFAPFVALALPAVFATSLVNLAAHGNPFYPVRTSIAGIALPGPEEPYASSPPWLAHAPQPARFVCSVLEIGVRPFSDPQRWTVDQWAPSDSSALRMGGFFGAWVVLCLALLAVFVVRDRSRVARASAAAFAAFTAILAWMPQSHELRYYLAWMIVLVALVLRLAARRGAIVGPRAIAGAGALAAALVLIATRAVYVVPTGSTFAELLRGHTNERALDGVTDGERVCAATPRWNLLWASTFHPPRHYVLKGAEDRSDCGGLRVVE